MGVNAPRKMGWVGATHPEELAQIVILTAIMQNGCANFYTQFYNILLVHVGQNIRSFPWRLRGIPWRFPCFPDWVLFDHRSSQTIWFQYLWPLLIWNDRAICSRPINLSVVKDVWKTVFQHVQHSQRPLLLCTFLYTWSPISEATWARFDSILTLSEFRQNVGVEYFTLNPVEYTTETFILQDHHDFNTFSILSIRKVNSKLFENLTEAF